MSEDVTEGELVLDLLRTTEVRADDDRATIGEDLLECGEGGTDTRVVRDVEVSIQGHIEVHTYECLLACEVELVNRHKAMGWL